MRGLLANRLLLSVLGLVLVTVLGVVHLFGQVLKTPLTHEPARVSVELERTGGLFEGAPASYRGVRVGTVREIGIDDGRVRAVVELREGTEVPRDTEAEVRSLSPVGEQYLDFRPDAPGGPYLTDGDVIEAEATDVPVAVAAAADELIGLVEAVDRRDLRTVLRETSIAVDGSAGDLESLLRSTDRLATALDGAWPRPRTGCCATASGWAGCWSGTGATSGGSRSTRSGWPASCATTTRGSAGCCGRARATSTPSAC